MSQIAIIPARGGSKRIPLKNIRDFYGKPIIAYAIEAALESKLFDEVMVSTDNHEITEVAIKYGANVPFLRSEINSNDHATLTDVLIEVLEKYEQMGKTFNQVCCILPTVPFITPNRIKQGFSLLSTSEFTSVLPVAAFSYPIQRSLKINSEGKAEMFWPENYQTRSQDFEPAFHDAGQFYCLNVKALLEEKRLYTLSTGVIKLNSFEVQDIDTYEDWNEAELKYELFRNRLNNKL